MEEWPNGSAVWTAICALHGSDVNREVRFAFAPEAGYPG